MPRPEGLPHLPRRAPDAHKNQVGRVLVIAGSVGMSGAAFLTAKAALRAGAGLVVTACPDAIQPVLAAKHTCVMVRPFRSTRAGAFHVDALAPLRDLVRDFDAVAIGPGLSRDPLAAELARRLATSIHDRPIAIDADALNALADAPSSLARLSPLAVLTPHPGELARLVGSTTRDVQAERRRAIARLVELTGAVVVLKGKGSLVAQRGSPIFENTTGNAGMATAGSGDVLTGVLAAMLAAKLAPFDAAKLAVWLHGAAGDAAVVAASGGPIIATDILDAVPRTIGAAMLEEAR